MEQSVNETIQLYQSNEHPCSYLSKHQAQNLVIDPELEKGPLLYGFLVGYGFRRSGTMIYRPSCTECDQCMPIRLPVDRFKPNRNQRRIWKRCNQVVSVEDRSASFEPEHYALFVKYLKFRHADGEMAHMSEDEYLQFLACSWLDTRFIEFRIDKQLVAVVISDRLPDGQSAVYTFFDPDYSKFSLGVYAVLWQIDACQKEGKHWLYLGYWIEACRKMSYKTHFQPYQVFSDNLWHDNTDI